MKTIWLILFFSFFCFISCSPYSGKKQPMAVKGVLDLRDWNYEKDGPVELSGEWKFFREKFVSPEKINDEKPLMIKVPLSWNAQKVNNKILPGSGYVTYYLKVLINPTRSNLALKFPSLGSAFECYVNGKKIHKAGKVGNSIKSSKPGYNPSDVEFLDYGDSLDIIIYASNFDHNYGGMWHAILFGDSKVIYEKSKRNSQKDYFILGVCVIMFLYYLGLAIQLPTEKIIVYFTFLCVFIGLRAIALGDMAILSFFPFISMEWMVRISYLTFYFLAICFFQFLYLSFPKEFHKLVNRAMIIFYVVLSILTFFSPPIIFTKFLIFAQVFYLIVLIYSFKINIIAITRKRHGSILMFIGFMVIAIGAVNDILFAMEIIDTIHIIIGFAFLVMLLVHSQMLSVRFMESFFSAERLSVSLDKKNIELRDLNINLESKVKDGTLELEEERNKLKDRNEKVEHELALAKMIQQELITKNSPADFISTLYKPMEKVGGDFYDFLSFRNSNKIGIFFSDVSGHGIPAAFITSMVKTIILQSGTRRDAPAEMLTYLNEVLFGQTAGNFVTVLYGIYDSSKRTLLYSNAGHPPPFIIGNDIYQLKEKKQTAIGMFSNEMLLSKNKLFENFRLELKPEIKVLLYTDGLAEATPINGGENFEYSKMTEVFQKNKSLKSSKFIETIYKELLAFRKDEVFDDDICLACLDVE